MDHMEALYQLAAQRSGYPIEIRKPTPYVFESVQAAMNYSRDANDPIRAIVAGERLHVWPNGTVHSYGPEVTT